MIDCIRQQEMFAGFSRRRVAVDFSGGAASSDGGILLVREADRRRGLLEAVAKRQPDRREAGRCRHSLLDLLRQRVYGLGHEDLNETMIFAMS